MKKILSMIRVDVNLVWFWYLLVTAVSLGLSAVLFLTATGSAVSGQEAGTEVCVTLAQTAENSNFILVFLVGLCAVAFMTELAWRRGGSRSRSGYLLCRLTMEHRQIFIAHLFFHLLLIAGYWGLFQLLYLKLAENYVTQMEAAGALGLNSQTILGAGLQFDGLLSFLPIGRPWVLGRNLIIIVQGATVAASDIADMPYNKSKKTIAECFSSLWVIILFLSGSEDGIVPIIYMVIGAVCIVVIVYVEVVSNQDPGELYSKEKEHDGIV